MYLWLFRVALDLFGKISQDHHPECGTQLHKYCRNADQLKSMFALHHCWSQTKEGTPTRCPKLSKQTLWNLWVRCEWIYDNDLALTYTKGAKEEKWGTNCKDPVGKVMKKVKDCIAVQNLKDLSSNLWTKWTAASTSGFSPFSPRWCWWSLWADNWNESLADFNIVAWF